MAYSPSLVNCGTEENSGDVDLLYSNEGAAVSYNEVAGIVVVEIPSILL